MNVAILITCFNRRETTLKCLEHLFGQDVDFDVFLVDDGSIDGTGESVKARFPDVFVIQGTGSLFWNGGMRLAWIEALKHRKYDFFIWLNDDTILDQSAIAHLLACNREIIKKSGRNGVVTGACRVSLDHDEFSYGGRDCSGALYPNGELQKCRYINGNIVLIPNEICEDIGILSSKYTHAHGDYDYGIRAIEAGYCCYTTKYFIATCAPNVGVPKWCNPSTPLMERLRLVNSPNGFALKDFVKYKHVDQGFVASIVVYFKIYFRVFFPNLYLILK
jgi:GT2 family glycosyltransferase